MFVFGMAVAAMTLYVGNKVYERLRRPRLPLIELGNNQAGPPTANTSNPQAMTAPLPGYDTALMSEDDSFELAKEIDRYLKVSFISLGFATAGSLVYAPLSLVCLPLLIYATIPVFRMAYDAVFRQRRWRIAILEAINIIGVLGLGYFFVGSLATIFIFLGHKLTLKVSDHSRKSLINVFGETPRTVWILKDDVEMELPFEDLRAGDLVVVQAGDTIPVDGHIKGGMGTVDQRMLTGEAQPVEKAVGDMVLAGTLVLTGRICVHVEKAGSDTVAAEIGLIWSRTAEFKASVELRSHEIADQTVLPTLSLGTLALLVLGPIGGVAALNSNGVGTLPIFGPLTMLNFLWLASQSGFLIKDGRSLDLLNEVDTVVFDKTGTLTQEQPHVGHIQPCNGATEDELLAYAAMAEYRQTHPIARAILQEAVQRELLVPEAGESSYEVGYGIKVELDGQLIRIGSARFMDMEAVSIPPDMFAQQAESFEQGYSLVYVALDEVLIGTIELRPTVRPEAKQVLQRLRQRHLSMYIISGDHEIPTRKLADELGIDHYFAETLPEHKASLIDQLQNEGKSVCFVGDGINDAIALKKAKVSISLRGASTVATDTAQVILMDESLRRLDEVFELSRRYDANMSNNLRVALFPSLFCLGGVFFLRFGILAAIVFFNLILAAGLANAMLPLFMHKPNGKIDATPYPLAEHTVETEIISEPAESVLDDVKEGHT